MTPTEPRGGEGLKPCPHCSGATNLHVLDYKVWCGDCKAYGPVGWTHESAIQAWNRRRPVVHGWPDREAVARVLDPETFDLIAHYTGIDRFDGLTAAEREPAVFKGYPSLQTARDTALAKVDAILSLFPPVVGWRGIDTAPRDGTPVDLWCADSGGHRVTDARWMIHHYMNGKPLPGVAAAWGPGSTDGPPPNPTHWMPLPAAPFIDGVG